MRKGLVIDEPLILVRRWVRGSGRAFGQLLRQLARRTTIEEQVAGRVLLQDRGRAEIGDLALEHVLDGLGPHLLRKPTRPAWFFERERYGGIITDLGSHQCDEFLWLADSLDVEIVRATLDNRANPETPGLQDIGEVMLRSATASGYFRVDWFTPRGMPVFGDCRLLIVGTEGSIEVRKYVDIGTPEVQPALLLCDAKGIRAVDFSDADPQYGHQLVADILDRTETAMSQAHCFKAMELALEAQAMAESS